ncbi:MAG: hypothetical protein A4E42_02183 [Methanoregulaceae archaeon PtaU1.Bin222]|nr:MAG: hypothetical protein A4E42_02183 [Methanoregulaceae archaeon PtaU1.Bin222]
MQSSIWPSSTSMSACLSSVANAIRETEQAFARGMSALRFFSVDPSLAKIYMPLVSFSAASSRSVLSWSLSMPAQMYALRAGPLSSGACPSIIGKSASFSQTPWSWPSTPGTFIISPSPITPSLPTNLARSFAVISAPPLSSGVAGTHDGNIKNRSTGSPSRSSSIYRRPSTPQTFAISCGSATTVVEPCIATTLAYSEGTRSELSI